MFCRKDIEDEESDSENYQSEIENYCKDIDSLRCLDISYLSDNEVPCITTSKEEDIKHIECDEDVKICKTSTLDCKILKVYTSRACFYLSHNVINDILHIDENIIKYKEGYGTAYCLKCQKHFCFCPESINYHILSEEEEEDNSLICSESIESTPSPEAPASTAPGPSTTPTTTTKNIQQKQSCHCNKREKASALPNQPTKNITIQALLLWGLLFMAVYT
ncbi:unnamed protein product [Acanthoscelides obtectus]|uniref:Uncharacterized protein n=1 Tax=Acanthoscelides obtectus TaxID=200917 RepID=A0A9P0MCK3_ACAOB|nr:unnamed protein product [Acanthoscelides obtectus]CAK1652226.1 hypothetical protein AOBTE_LOCUS17742 [Acanthoscelides obtectus]